MLFADLAAASHQVAAASSRKRKVEVLAACLRAAQPGEAAIAVAYLSGELRQRRTGLGYAALRELPAPAEAASLHVAEVDATFARIAELNGPGSVGQRRGLLCTLYARATAQEQRFLTGLVGGELRQGALEAVMAEAVAAAAGVAVSAVRRALMLRGSLGPVAAAALAQGTAGLAQFRLQLGRPVQPMLAQSADDVAAALARTGPAAVEEKLDGVRIQVHRNDADVAVFTRTLEEITARVPEVVAAVAGLPVRSLVLDGEALTLTADGRPRPFQQTAARVASRIDVAPGRGRARLSPYFFDVLHRDGQDLLDQTGEVRQAALTGAVPPALQVPRLVRADAPEAHAFFDAALARGHEGVVVKSLAAPYEAGRRGAGWVKVKPRHTLDLVVLAAEWGHGRRRGWLSNLHLGARDRHSGDFVMLGKTFKGLTDAMLAEQTERLLELAVRRDAWVVHVRPELVVEVAFDGVQSSPRYPGGIALRFARVLRYRPDKRAQDADSIDALEALHAAAGGERG